jgi:aldose 1-epimerase
VPFGTTPDGTEVELFVLGNARTELAVATYGGIVQRLLVPDRDGVPGDVVLGFSTLEEYVDAGSLYLGAIIGRYANRIAGGSFELDGATYSLPRNEGENSLHGGTQGFDRRVWRPVDVGVDSGDATLSLAYTSADGEMGYPGTLEVAASYRLAADGSLRLDFHATTDGPTVINLTGHSYWNLAGEGSGTVDGQCLTLHAERYVGVDRELLPTGELPVVAGTPLDFRTPRPVGESADGYDFTFVLDREAVAAGELVRAADLYDPLSGRSLSIATTEPGIHFYSGRQLDGSTSGKAGRAYQARAGLALETQHFGDSPNHPGFPSTVLRPGEVFSSSTVWSFGTDLDFQRVGD